MQENGIGWDPIYVSRPLPWFVKVYVFYLVYAVIRSSVQFISCGKHVWQRKAESGSATQLASLKRRAITVVLAALVVSVTQIFNALRLFETTVVGPRALVGEISEGLVPMTMGLIVALTMHLAISLIEGAIDKRRLSSDQA